MRVHAVRLGPEYLVFLLIVLFAVPQDGLAACVRSGLMPILTRVTTAINSSMACERWCQSGRLLSYSSSRFQPRPAGETTLPAFECRLLNEQERTVKERLDLFDQATQRQRALGTVNCNLLVTTATRLPA